MHVLPEYDWKACWALPPQVLARYIWVLVRGDEDEDGNKKVTEC